jgi:hypothetical protein
MKTKRMIMLCCIGMLVVSMIQLTGLATARGDEAVTINLPGQTITLYPPFEVVNTTMYRDGGTIAIVIKDSKENSFPFCLDGRIKRPSPLRHVYVGAMHPGDAKAQQIPIGSDTEKTILKILTSAQISESAPNVKKDLVETVIHELENR